MAKFDFYFICQWIALILLIYVMVIIFKIPLDYRYQSLNQSIKDMNIL
jgi:hypothetical protein